MTDPSPAAEGRSMVTGIFHDGTTAEEACEAAVRLGYGKDEINVVMSDETRKRFFAEPRAVDTDLGRKSAEGGELGGPKGGRIGILLPILAAVGTTVALSGVGLIVAGPIAAAITAAGATGVAAGLIGAMADWGIPEERQRLYEADIHEGGILLAVKARTEEDARAIARRWSAMGGDHVLT